jgi:hypothetical protein
MNLYIYESARKDKRFLAVFLKNDIVQFKINFGSKNGMTFVDHGDILKRENYLKRHSVNEDWNLPNSAGSLSRWLLWGDSDKLETNIKAFKKRFQLK